VRAIELARTNPAALGKTYAVSGRTVVTFNELLDHILLALGRRRMKLHFPLPLCWALAKVVGRVSPGSFFTPDALLGLIQDATLDWSDFHRTCGYLPIPLAAGLEGGLHEVAGRESSRPLILAWNWDRSSSPK
jgi:uncharacterized protein YbjT (DUF2867 family)